VATDLGFPPGVPVWPLLGFVLYLVLPLEFLIQVLASLLFVQFFPLCFGQWQHAVSV
jgi:hypothetical protein